MTHSIVTPSDLPIVNGRVYHLDLAPGEISNDIIIVGDPDRVLYIADEFLDAIEVVRFHRGLRSVTGRVRETGQRVSVVTSGMGTPSTEIVLNEIVALNEIDFRTGKRKEKLETINIIRVGTSGGIRPRVELGTLIVTDYVVGMDNTGLFYDAGLRDEYCRIIEDRVREAIDSIISDRSRFKGRIYPYASRAHVDVVNALAGEAERLGVAFRKGITVSNSGFFGNEGRRVGRIPLTVPDMDTVLAELYPDIPGERFENMEMESSFLIHFMTSHGYKVGVICPVIDNRREGTFMFDYKKNINDAVRIALRALSRLRGAA